MPRRTLKKARRSRKSSNYLKNFSKSFSKELKNRFENFFGRSSSLFQLLTSSLTFQISVFLRNVSRLGPFRKDAYASGLSNWPLIIKIIKGNARNHI